MRTGYPAPFTYNSIYWKLFLLRIQSTHQPESRLVASQSPALAESLVSGASTLPSPSAGLPGLEGSLGPVGPDGFTGFSGSDGGSFCITVHLA